MNFHTLVRKNGSLKTGRTHTRTHAREKIDLFSSKNTALFSSYHTHFFFTPAPQTNSLESI